MLKKEQFLFWDPYFVEKDTRSHSFLLSHGKYYQDYLIRCNGGIFRLRLKQKRMDEWWFQIRNRIDETKLFAFTVMRSCNVSMRIPSNWNLNSNTHGTRQRQLNDCSSDRYHMHIHYRLSWIPIHCFWLSPSLYLFLFLPLHVLLAIAPFHNEYPNRPYFPTACNRKK